MFNFFNKKTKDSGAEIAMEGFKGVKHAFEQQLIKLEQGRTHDDIYLHMDQPDGTIRLTYVMFSPTVQNEIVATCTLVFERELNGLDVWSVEWAVDEKYRNKGFGLSIVAKGVNEFKSGMSGKGKNALWLESIVSTSNTFSNSIASKVIGNCETLLNKSTNEQVNNYLSKVEIKGN